MDWVRDVSGLHSWDLDRVFKYEPKPTTVLRINRDKAVLWSIETHEEWKKWVELTCPSPKDSESGLVVLFARRYGDSTGSKVNHTEADNWLNGMEVEFPVGSYTTQGLDVGMDNKSNEKKHELRTVPFSRNTFEMITKAFYVHSSISRAISRADMPVFSHTGAVMEDEDGLKHEASIFNCRTSNAWPMDLALTITYFPRCNLKFAVIFGCDLSVEEEILNRLLLARNDASHPMLLPGILAETERKRHVQIVDDIVDEVEARIFQLEIKPDAEYGIPKSHMDKLHKEKRSAWLNISYIRNCLVSWRKQLENIELQVDKIDRSFVAEPEWSDETVTSISHTPEGHPPLNEDRSPAELDQVVQVVPTCLNTDISASCREQFGNKYLTTGYKIKSRTRAIIEEYDDKIRDCSMRIDGMAMATQWAQGDTNLEIAKATSRDSKHMRSIALVTMVFLPGTFFAGVFSMTFFSWSDDSGHPAISGYVWIYVVITTFFTMLTIFLWYYFNIYRSQVSTDKVSDV
ncbi:hypothetical protein EV127DRAFT_448982 [Xylaria flabelliformis]|nr:hypothetical protein EV127DRAFT_448982 [Xylaria flabelliformis]